MKFSLIVPTIGRVQELERLFRSLSVQSRTDFEVIVSDQNEDDRLLPVIQRFAANHRVLHLKSQHGASRARNIGINQATGDIVTFPDDDCAYPPDILERVALFFDEHAEYAFLTGRSYADDGEDAITHHDPNPSKIQRYRIHRQCIEHVFFIRRTALATIRFDETMGPGSPTLRQADEGPDLALTLEDAGHPGFYNPAIAVWHPRISIALSNPYIFDRAYGYACGNGYFLRKHRYSTWYFRSRLARTFLGGCLALLSLRGRKARFYFSRLRGLWRGWHDDQEVSR